MQTIIFLSGFAIPNWLSKTKFIWNKPFWENYNCIFLTSKIPISDNMVERELYKLSYLTQKIPNAIVAGHSLGAWWAGNLACHPESKIQKLILWTPLGDTTAYPIFNVTKRFNPIYNIPNKKNVGGDKALLISAKNDLVVPAHKHAHLFMTPFKPTTYELDGGHFYQKNHKEALQFMKKWIMLK